MSGKGKNSNPPSVDVPPVFVPDPNNPANSNSSDTASSVIVTSQAVTPAFLTPTNAITNPPVNNKALVPTSSTSPTTDNSYYGSSADLTNSPSGAVIGVVIAVVVVIIVVVLTIKKLRKSGSDSYKENASVLDDDVIEFNIEDHRELNHGWNDYNSYNSQGTRRY
ncbi:13563_t:CDS:2 [Racocetra fulgida]|uniref:13563_t:CDS:1 n=1 Tax=Racocetra fulgida TaxID=60492 RepID=A0A9N9H6Z4_9GLOM|nr:13563_t:CDS:2 [Racocetra fulgida]